MSTPESKSADHVINSERAPIIQRMIGERWGASYRILTPSMRPKGGSLGVNWICVPPGRASLPFHTHRREDEVFYVLSGRGMLRYGDDLREIGAGDCISCPAGTQAAHQIANPFDEDLIYLAIGTHDAHEVCTYPDSGKVMVRSLQTVGKLEATDYMQDEADTPLIFELARASADANTDTSGADSA